jgi:hypothetical protein
MAPRILFTSLYWLAGIVQMLTVVAWLQEWISVPAAVAVLGVAVAADIVAMVSMRREARKRLAETDAIGTVSAAEP